MPQRTASLDVQAAFSRPGKQQAMQTKHQTLVSAKGEQHQTNNAHPMSSGKPWALGLAALVLLSACGGGGGSVTTDKPLDLPLAPAAQLANACVTPGSGEKQGTVEDEKAWVRSYIDERYL